MVWEERIVGHVDREWEGKMVGGWWGGEKDNVRKRMVVRGGEGNEREEGGERVKRRMEWGGGWREG